MPRILVVDDDDDIRDSVVDLLQMEQFDAVGARDGAEALAVLRGGGPPVALILLDLMMPHVDGWSFRRQQLADPAIAQIPVVVMSAINDAPDALSRAQPTDVLPKPLELAALLAVVKRHLPA